MDASLPLRFGPEGQPLLVIGDVELPLVFRRHPRARRYVLRLDSRGHVRVTIPRAGSNRGAHDFLLRHLEWVRQQLARRAADLTLPKCWNPGAQIWFRGRLESLGYDPSASVLRLGGEVIPIHGSLPEDLRPVVQRWMRGVAERELPGRTMALAARLGLTVRRVSVRNQRSRWGSCSVRGTISLNWRLVQVPENVCAYLLVHELMHLKAMNHSPQFWRHVAEACPDYEAAEAWLKQYSRQLM